MSAAWVAGSVRARLLLERCAGVERVKELAGAASLSEAVVKLAGTAYAPVAKSSRATLEEAQRGVAGCAALELRVLAAWLPPEAKPLLRSLAAWFELVNIEKRPSTIGPPRKFYSLNAAGHAELATFWAKWDFVSFKINELKGESV